MEGFAEALEWHEEFIRLIVEANGLEWRAVRLIYRFKTVGSALQFLHELKGNTAPVVPRDLGRRRRDRGEISSHGLPFSYLQ